MIHIADTKVARRYGDFFIRQFHKFDEVGLQSESVTFLNIYPLACRKVGSL